VDLDGPVLRNTGQSHRHRTSADETHKSFCQQWFPARDRVPANAMPGDFDLSWWGFRAAASFYRPISICKPVGEAEVDSLCAAMHVLPVSSFLVCPKFLGLHQEFSCQHFPSPVERLELCRYTSESAGVARLAPCPIGRPSLPARYALGVGERCGG
jgi:hypothetical protein